VLSVDIDEIWASMRDGPATGTGLAASQPPFATVPEIELVPARPAPAKAKHATAVTAAARRAPRCALSIVVSSLVLFFTNSERQDGLTGYGVGPCLYPGR
jgi:hypothetical protein